MAKPPISARAAVLDQIVFASRIVASLAVAEFAKNPDAAAQRSASVLEFVSAALQAAILV